MKKLLCFFLAISLLFSLALNAYSIKIDGYDGGVEWINAESELLVNGDSNCNVNFGLVKWIVEPESNSVFLCVMFKDPDVLSSNTNVGVSLQVGNSDPFIVTVATTPNQADIDKYYFDGSVTVDDNCGVTSEIKLGIKYGLPDEVNFKIRFYDSYGSPSNVYELSVETVTTTQSETTSSSTATQAKSTTSAKIKTTKTPDKETTNKKTTVKTVLRTTDAANNTTVSEIKTTKKKQKTTKKTTVKSTAVAAIINDTIITSDIDNTTLNSVIQSEYSDSTESNSENRTPQINKYKIMTMVAGGITLVAISVLGTIKSKKDNKEDRNS